MADIDKLIDKVVEESGIDSEEVRTRMDKKKEVMHGLLSDYGAVYAVAKELWIDLNQEEIRHYRGTLVEPGKDSPYRERSIKKNLDLFTRMRQGEFEDGSRVLRAKIDMTSPNLNMRDPTLYRIRRFIHHRTKDKWCIYPMYDFDRPTTESPMTDPPAKATWRA